jgi:hypothetical protein
LLKKAKKDEKEVKKMKKRLTKKTGFGLIDTYSRGQDLIVVSSRRIGKKRQRSK